MTIFRAPFDTDPYISFVSTELDTEGISPAPLASLCWALHLFDGCRHLMLLFLMRTRLLCYIRCHLLVPHNAFSVVGTIWRRGYTHEILLRALLLCTFNKYSVQASKVDLWTLVLKFSTVYYVTIHQVWTCSVLTAATCECEPIYPEVWAFETIAWPDCSYATIIGCAIKVFYNMC